MEPLTANRRAARLLLGLILAAAPVAQTDAASALGAAPAKATRKVKSMTQMLSADLIPLIADPAINMLAVRLVGLDGNLAVQDGLQVQTGPAWFEIADVIHGRGFLRGQTIEVPVSQIIDPQTRDKNGANQWNNLSLQRGATLVLACPPAPKGTPCVARAAIQITSANAGAVDALRQCYAIEAEKGRPEAEYPQKLVPMVAAALQSHQELLFLYALDFAGRRAVLGRDTGASLLSRAVAHPGMAPAARYDIATYIAMQTSLFEPARKLDRANLEVVSAYASGLVAETDPNRKIAWTRLLGSCLLSELAPRQAEADALRRALAHGVRVPAPAQVVEALQSALATAAGSDRATLSELLALWR